MMLKARIRNVMLLIAVIGIGLAGLVEWRRPRAPRLKVVAIPEGVVVLDYTNYTTDREVTQGKPGAPKSSP
jgi:hypothetical protein